MMLCIFASIYDAVNFLSKGKGRLGNRLVDAVMGRLGNRLVDAVMIPYLTASFVDYC
jgi:hypothetical protein